MGSPSPASPVTQTTQVSQMDPRLYQWLYGTANSPGRQQIANAAIQGKTMQGVQNADPTALAAYYNVPKGTDLSQFQSHTGAMNPGQADPSLMQFPGQSITPQDYYNQATANEKKGAKDPTSTANAAKGGELKGYAKGGLTQDQYNFLQNKIQNGGKVSPGYQKQMQAYEAANPAPASTAPTGNVPLSQSDAQIGVTPFYDPTTMQSTNPYYNQAVSVLQGMGNMPSQYQQAGNVYNQAAQGLLGQTNYTPQQVQAMQEQAATYQAQNMQAPKDISAQGYDAAQAQVNQMADPLQVQAVRTRAARMQGPQSWTSPGTSQQYMDPYIQNVLNTQQQIANQQFAQQQNQLRSQATGQKAFGGARSQLAQGQAQFNQNLANQNMVQQGLSNAYQSGLGQFNTAQGQNLQAGQANLSAQMQANLANQQAGMTAQQLNQAAGLTAGQANLSAAQQTALANQAATNAEQQQYVQNALAAAQTNYGGQLTAAQQNQVAQNAASQFNAQSQNQINLANQQANLQAQTQNQQAGLSGQGLNLQAWNQAGQQAAGLLNTGQGIGNYNQNLMQNWGAAGNTLQNLAQNYYNTRQQSAQNLWGGVGSATQQATGTLLGSPWGTTNTGVYQSRKKGGKLSIRV